MMKSLDPDGENIGSFLTARAWRCLGGTRQWTGRVRGVFGLIRRGLTISSVGEWRDEMMVFSEEMEFSDGETQTREWSIEETPEGLVLHSDKIDMLQNGHLQGGDLVFEYRMRLGRLLCSYRDVFKPLSDGGVENIGTVRWMGLPIMKIHMIATPPA